MQRPRLKVLLDETAQVEGYQIEGAFPMFGNDSRGCDQTATAVVGADSKKVVRPPSCRHEHPHPFDPCHDRCSRSRGPWSLRKE
jgi:hypothetical protein